MILETSSTQRIMETVQSFACTSKAVYGTSPSFPCTFRGLQACLSQRCLHFDGEPLLSKFTCFNVRQALSSLYSEELTEGKSKVAMRKGNSKQHPGRSSLSKAGFGINLNPRFRRSACITRFVAAAAFRDKDAGKSAVTERSDSANEEILLFFFQLDLTTRVQRALNLDQYELAQQLREKLVEVDQEMARQREQKMGALSSKDEAQDKAISILRLRDQLQKAVKEEDYAGAARLRDRISKLEAESLAAAANALVYQNVQFGFRLGQNVNHVKFGYRGVICGMDPVCCESEMWINASAVEDLTRGRNQPFYQVLVDMSDDPTLMVAYVAEENLVVPKEPALLLQSSFDHPYISFLFYGTDAAGDFIPIKQLRDKYNQERHELPWKGEENNSKGNDGDL